MKSLTNEQFIDKAIKVHGNQYDYSKVLYDKRSTKVDIICHKHGVFAQRAGNHLSGCGCPRCFVENITSSDFIIKAKQVHGNRYDYNESVYLNNNTPIKIICKTHGTFFQRPAKHILSKHGCPKCGGTAKLTAKDFIEKSQLIHENKYDYSLVDYKKHCIKVIIICRKHGSFNQTPNRHLQGDGCPKCNSSKGEARIRKYLDNHNFIYKEQLGFETCRNKRKLPFDFVIYNENKYYNIEYHGEQHYELVNFTNNNSRAVNKFEKIKKHDIIKKQWCVDNSIPLCIIPYWNYDKIESILDKFVRMP